MSWLVGIIVVGNRIYLPLLATNRIFGTSDLKSYNNRNSSSVGGIRTLVLLIEESD